MGHYVSRLILAGCLMVPCLLFGQVTIECIVNETVTAGECNDCTNITDSVFVKFGLRCINGSDTTILEGPVRIKARGSSGDVVMFDYRANPPQSSTQTFFFNVSAAAQFGDIQDVFAYVRDCASFLVDYGDSTNRVHWGDTMHITYPESSIAPGDTTYYWLIQVNGSGTDTITMGETVNFVESGMVTITKGPTNVVIHVPNMYDTCRHTLVQVTDTTAALLDCLGDTMGIIAFAFPDGLQHLYALPDSSNRLILTDGDGVPLDTVDFFGLSGGLDTYADSASVWLNDTIQVYRIDTSGAVVDSFPLVIPRDSIDSYTHRGTFADDTLTIYRVRGPTEIDSFKVEIIIDSDTDIDSMKLIGNTLHLWEDDVHLSTDLSQFMDNTDDQQLSLVTDGLIDTIILEDGSFVVLHDSVGTNTNDTYLSDQWCSGDTLYAERSDTSGIIDTLIVSGIPCSRDTCEIMIDQITSVSGFGYSLVTGLRYTYCGVEDSICFTGSIKYIPYQHLDDTLYFLTEEIVDCDSVTFGVWSVYIDPGNDIRLDTAWFVDDTLYQQRVDTSGIIDTVLTEIITKDFDFIKLDGDTMMTLVDTLIPRDSSDLHKLIWHGGRVRLGQQGYEHSIYLDTTSGDYLNFVLHQDSATTGLQIFGRRSALDIYHQTRPYIHVRNQFGEFWHRVFDPTGEGPFEPQRYEIGAVGKYDGDTTSRAIFTIDNDADAYSLNITPNFLQSDIYTSDRAVDTSNIHGIFAADSSGQFVLMKVDSVGDINIINPPDADWHVWSTSNVATDITQNIFTEGKAYVGDGINITQFQFQILHDTNSYAFRTYTSENYSEWMMELENEEAEGISWFHAGQSNTSRRDWRITNDAGATTGVYAVFKEGYDEILEPAFIVKSDGDIGFGQYKESRDDLESSSAITNMIYMSDDAITSESFGVMKMASIDSLAAAINATGLISSADSLGRNGTAGQIVIETATKAPQSSANLFFDLASTELGVGTSLPAQTIHVQGTARITGSDGTATTVTGRDADGDISTVALGTNLSITSGTLNAAGDNMGTTVTTGKMMYGQNSTVPDFSTTFHYIEASESLGIGTATPGTGIPYDTKLHLWGDGSSTGGRTAMVVENTTANSAALIQVKNSDGNTGSLQITGPSYAVPSAATFSTEGVALQFTTDGNVASGGTNPIRFSPGGHTNVFATFLPTKKAGFAITTPEETLDVLGLSNFRSADSQTSASQLFVGYGTNPRVSGLTSRNMLSAVSTTVSSGVGFDIRAFRHLGSEGSETDWTSTSSVNMLIGSNIWRNGSFAGQAHIRFSDDGSHGVSNASGNISFWTSDATTGFAERVRIDPDGEVGIGTINPTNTLHVVGGGTFSGLAGTGTRMVTATSAGVLGTATIPSGADGNGFKDGSGTIPASTTATALGTFTISDGSTSKLVIANGSSTTYLRAQSGASVHVGDDGDEWGLYNNGGSETRLRNVDRGTLTYFFIGDASGSGLQSNGSTSWVGSSTSISTTSASLGLSAFSTLSLSSGSDMSIDATGTMSLSGTQFQFTDNSQSLYVFESSGNMNIGNANTTSGTNEYITFTSTTMGLNVASTTILGLTSTYAQTGATIELHVGHGTKIGAANDELEVTGDAYKTVGGVEWNTTSDRRIKQDIEYIDGKKAIDLVKQLRPASYHYTDYWANKNGVEPGKRFYSYIAQDVEDLFPGSVYRSTQTLPGDQDPIRVIDGDIISAHERAALVQLIRDNEQQAAQIGVLTEQINKLYQLINKQ